MATSPQRKQGRKEAITGGLLAGHGAASAPLLRQGRKSPTSMVGASPKKQAGRYQAELTDAMKQGKVPSNSTLKVFKTPSGRYINTGGTHRHIAREAMGQGTPEHKIEVKSIDFEPHHSLYAEAQSRLKINELKRGSKAALKGKVRPVSSKFRAHNATMARNADINDAMVWEKPPHLGTVGRQVLAAHRASEIGSAALVGAGGVALAAHGLHQMHQGQKRPVSKALAIPFRGIDAGAGSKITSMPGRVGRLKVRAKVGAERHARVAAKKADRGMERLGARVAPHQATALHNFGFISTADKPAVNRAVGAGALAAGALAAGGTGALVGGSALYDKHKAKKVSKSMDGHSAFQAISKSSEKVAADTKKVTHPPEVSAYIERKKREMGGEKVSKSAFLDEDVNKALPGLDMAGALKNAVPAVKQGLGMLKPKAISGLGAAQRGGVKAFGAVKAHPKMYGGALAGGAVGGHLEAKAINSFKNKN